MMNPKLVHHFLEVNADRFPEKVALVCDEHRLTYAAIEEQANRLARAFSTQGITRGDRVVLFLPNCVELVVSIFATLKAGAVFVVVNPSTKFEKLAYIIENCQASACISTAVQGQVLERLLQNRTSLKFGVVIPDDQFEAESEVLFYFDRLIDAHPGERLSVDVIDLDLACLIYTSGSTGEAKGVMSDHSNVVFAVQSITAYLENVEDDVVIDVLPLSFDYGLYQLLMTFSFGGRLVLEKGFAYPAQIMKRIEEERVTGFPGVPTLFSRLLSMDLAPYELSSLRYMTNTAAALAPAHIEHLRQKLPDVRLYSMYGLTETKRTLYLPPDQLDRRPDSVGIAIPGTEVWLEDERGDRLGPGETGELVVRGRHVMRGYWGDPIASAERFPTGPIPGERICRTGDLFRMDENGFLYFVARSDDIIKSRGEKVSPKEIENVLYQLEGVREAAVIGVPDPTYGQVVKAFVVSDGVPLTEVEVLRHCRAHLEDLMVPRIVEFCDALPKTASGKIKKTGLV